MVKPTINELAALKESIFNVQTPKGGSLIFVALMISFTGLEKRKKATLKLT